VVRRTPEGKAMTAGDQISIEKSIYLSLCRGHWEEETGRWPLAKPQAKPGKVSKPVAKKKSKAKPSARLRVAAAAAPRPGRRTKS
jgi:hypothetical protein